VGGIPERAIDSSPPKHPNWFQCPPTDVFIGYQGAFPRLHKPRHVAYHSPPSNAKVKNERSYISTPSMPNGVDKDNLTFLPSLTSLSAPFIGDFVVIRYPLTTYSRGELGQFKIIRFV
jgi:hypothetical protein